MKTVSMIAPVTSTAPGTSAPARSPMPLNRRAAEIQARASDAVRERMFAEWLDLCWPERTRDLGRPTGFQVSCWRSDRVVMADATITFADGTLDLRIGFVPSGQVSGLSLLSPPR